MKRMLAFALMLCLMLSLAACGQKNSGKQETSDGDQLTVEEPVNEAQDHEMDADAAAAQESGEDAAQEEQTISGIVNRFGDYLVLLDGDDEYRIFDFGEGVDKSKLEEGDKVTVTYTGELGSEDPAPVAVSIQKNG